MFDLFGRKAKAEAEQAQRDLRKLERDQEEYIRKLEGEVTVLKNALRKVDEQIYKMSQFQSWSGMQPYFTEMLYDTELRRRQESNLVSNLVIKELNKA